MNETLDKTKWLRQRIPYDDVYDFADNMVNISLLLFGVIFEIGPKEVIIKKIEENKNFKIAIEEIACIYQIKNKL